MSVYRNVKLYYENVFNVSKESYTEKEFKRFLKSVDKGHRDGQTLVIMACRHHSDVVKLVLEKLLANLESSEIKTLVREKTRKNQTALMISAKKEKVFETLWDFIENNFDSEEQKEMLLEEDQEGWKVFHWAIHGQSTDNIKILSKIYSEKLGNETLKEILLKENKYGNSVLHFTIYQYGNKRKVEIIWNLMQDLLDNEILKKMFLKTISNINNELNYFRVWSKPENLKIFESFIIKICFDNDSNETFLILGFVAEFCELEFLEKILAHVEQNNKFATLFFTKLF